MHFFGTKGVLFSPSRERYFRRVYLSDGIRVLGGCVNLTDLNLAITGSDSFVPLPLLCVVQGASNWMKENPCKTTIAHTFVVLHLLGSILRPLLFKGSIFLARAI